MIDWEEMKREYVCKRATYRQLAERYGASASEIAARGRAERWREARAEEERARTDEPKDHLRGMKRAAEQLVNVIARAFADPDQWRRHLIKTREGGGWETEERVYGKLDTHAIREMAAAMKDMSVTLRGLYDIPTEAERLQMEMNTARLQRELSKDSEEDDAGGVILISPTDAPADAEESEEEAEEAAEGTREGEEEA